MHEYEVSIIGDNGVAKQGRVSLTYEEYSAFNKVIDALRPGGKAAPIVLARDLTVLRGKEAL